MPAAQTKAYTHLQTSLLNSMLYPYRCLPQHISLFILEWIEKELITIVHGQYALWRQYLVGYFAGDSDRTPRLIFRSIAFPDDYSTKSFVKRFVSEKDPWLHFVLRHARSVTFCGNHIPVPLSILSRCNTISVLGYHVEYMRFILDNCGEERTLRIRKLDVVLDSLALLQRETTTHKRIIIIDCLSVEWRDDPFEFMHLLQGVVVREVEIRGVWQGHASAVATLLQKQLSARVSSVHLFTLFNGNQLVRIPMGNSTFP